MKNSTITKQLFAAAFLLFNLATLNARADDVIYGYAKRLGGTYNTNCGFMCEVYDRGTSIAVDASGNVYTTGAFIGTTDFDPGAGTYNLTSVSDNADIFVSKLDANGNFVWAKSMGGTSTTSADYGYDIAVDTSGNVYTVGQFNGTVDFDPGAATYNLVSAGQQDIFISKLDANGNFVWAKRTGTTTRENARSVVLDVSGNVYMTGNFTGMVDFDPGAGVNNLTAIGSFDVFVSKLDTNGNFIWARNMGGSNVEGGYGITVDSSGNVYSTGSFQSTADFDPGAGVYNLTAAGGYEIFVSKLDTNGNFIWARSMGGTGDDFSYSIAVDNSGNVCAGGSFQFTADFDPGAGTTNLASAGGEDIFISKLDVNGNFVWAKGMGGSSTEVVSGIAVDGGGNVYATGGFQSTMDFDPGVGVYTLIPFGIPSGAPDIFVSKLDTNGNFIWAKGMGGSNVDSGYAIALDGNSNIYTTGYFKSTADFDPGVGTANLTVSGNTAIFISKLSNIHKPKNDYNNDGIAGWIWKGQSNGVETQSQIWQLTFPLLSANFGVPNRFYPPPFADQANWELLTSGDFNKDGDADIVWRNKSTDDWKIWQMQNGTRVAQTSWTDSFDPAHAWQVIGAGDTDKDGDDDVILNNTTTGDVIIWEMQDHAIVATHNIGAKAGYVLNRIGDFNKDGDVDLLFRQIGADVLVTWEIENNLFVQERALANTGTGYNPVCAGDFDKDGDDDILQVNSSTTQEKWFEMEAYARLSQKFGATNTGFSFMGCGDYDGDGDADILWQRSADDANRVVLQQNYGVTKQTVYTNVFGGENPGAAGYGFKYRNNGN